MWPFRKKQAEPATTRPASLDVTVDHFLGDQPARALRTALGAGDWGAARAILAGSPDPEHTALLMRTAADTPGVQGWIENAVRDDPESPWPLLVRGAHAVYWAWEARGSGMSDTVGQDQWKVWFARLKLAENCLDEVLERDPRNAEAWHYLVILGRARQLPFDERWYRFTNLIDLNPTHYMGHTQMLNNVMAKWSGSDDQMFEFARERGAKYPGTGLPSLVAAAHLEHRFRNGGNAYMERAEVGDEIVEAARQSIWHPDYRPVATTPLIWNRFAHAFALADRFEEAEWCFQRIGDRLVTDEFEGASGTDADTAARYAHYRDYVRGRLRS
ncbi:MAG: hypothetical protein HOV79_29585 [Hamadaea sp.]|nr:hypothetical protein [Hamadaea sp.]